MYLPENAKRPEQYISRNGMDTHARQVETKHARSLPPAPMRHWGKHGPHGLKAGPFGDPEISLGWRHSG